LQAELTEIEPGSRISRPLVISNARASVRALLRAHNGRFVATFTCSRATSGGPLGVGGWLALWQSSESLVRSDLRKLARDLAQELGRIAERSPQLAGRRHDQVAIAEPGYRKQVWLQKPVERWSLDDATKVFATFQVHSRDARRAWGEPVAQLTGIHGLWLTVFARQAHARTLELLQQGRKRVGNGIHPFVTALDPDTLRSLEAKGSYAFAVWPLGDKPPVYWNPSEILASTFIRRAGHPNERIGPTALVGPPWPPALFLFSEIGSDGEPLVSGLDQKLELYTSLNGRDIVCRFDLSHFGLRELKDLLP